MIAGGSGYLGINLARYLLNRGYDVTILSRSRPEFSFHSPTKAGDKVPTRDFETVDSPSIASAQPTGHCEHVPWDGRTLDSWASALEGSAALVNLAGRTVDCIKTPETMDQILRSRVESTLALGQALKTVRKKPGVWVQMSTAHIYGDSLEMCDESSAYGYGLAPDVGRAWESALEDSLPRGMRTVILRTSFVIGRSGGALKRLALLVRLGLGGTVGHGKQGMSWIHEEDMNRLFWEAIENRRMRGAYIASAPEPVSQREFMRSLRKAMGMPMGLPATAWMVKLGAPLLMNTDPDLALYGRYCRSARLKEAGFQFQYAALDSALADIYAKNR